VESDRADVRTLPAQLHPHLSSHLIELTGSMLAVSGLVEEVSLRTITLRDLSGNVHIVPNGIVDRVKNMTKGYSYYVFDIRVAYREDVDRVMAVLIKIAAEFRADPLYAADILEPMPLVHLLNL
jgi:moderate conductance mechanosensitive channel